MLTSSCAAVVDFAAPFKSEPKKVYTEEDWNPTTWDGALTGTPNTAYQASKKLAEKSGKFLRFRTVERCAENWTAWEFVEKEQSNFDLVMLTPPMIYGPLRHSISSVSQLNESNARIYNLFINSKEDAELPPNGLHVYTDVRDIALAHVKAATIPEASGQRIIIWKGQITSQEISDILRKNIPELEKRTPKGTTGTSIDPHLFTASSEKVVKILGLTYRSKEETIVDLAKQLLEIEKKEKLWWIRKDSLGLGGPGGPEGWRRGSGKHTQITKKKISIHSYLVGANQKNTWEYHSYGFLAVSVHLNAKELENATGTSRFVRKNISIYPDALAAQSWWLMKL
jgi:hypothetical protein